MVVEETKEVKEVTDLGVAETKEAPVAVKVVANLKVKAKVVEALVILTSLLLSPVPCTGNTGNQVTSVQIRMCALGSTRLSQGQLTTNEPKTSSVLKIKVKSTTSFCLKL